MSDDKRQPWMKWYWSDWRASPKLRLCSLAARGLWAEMLAICEQGEPYGHLTISGIAPTPRQLAVQVGAGQKEVEELLQELEEARVFSRTTAEVIYSRRMVRDKAKAENDKRNGAKGGNPKIAKAADGGKPPAQKSDAGGKPEIASSPPAGKPNGADPPQGGKPEFAGGVKAQRPEARGQKPTPESQASPTASAPAEDWEAAGQLVALWDAKQREVFQELARQQPTGKDQVTAARWLRQGLTLEAAPAAFEGLFRGLQERGRPVPKSLAFLDGDVLAWVSQRKAAAKDPREYFGTDRPGQILEEQYWRLVRWHERNRWDDDNWGPRPGMAGCQVPKRVFEVYRLIHGGGDGQEAA